MGAGAGARVHYLPGWCTPLQCSFGLYITDKTWETL